MADQKISALNALTNPDPVTDVIPIVSSGANFKISRNNYLSITGLPVGTTDTQVLTNKTLTAPTISSPVLSGTVTGTYTLAGTPTFPAAVVTLTGSQTLTNKVLTSPTINAPTITNASITQDAVVGFSSANSGTVYGIPITSSTMPGTAIATGSITSTQIATNGIGASNLATNAITLGYAQITSNFTGTGFAVQQVTGLTATVTIPAGARRVRVTAQAVVVNGTGTASLTIWDGAVGSGTQLQQFNNVVGNGILLQWSGTPAAGSKTYNIAAACSSGTISALASTTFPAFILVEAV